MGGGGVSIPQRNFSDEWPNIKQGYKGQENQYRQFANNEPLLSGATDASLAGLGDINSLIGPLKDLLGNLPGAQGYADQLKGYSGQLGDLGKPLGALSKSFQDIYGTQIDPILKSGGALTVEQQRNADQAALGLASGAGMANANAGIAGALLNRDQFRQQRFGNALQQGQGLAGSIGGLTQGQAGLIGQQAGLTQSTQDVFGKDIAQRLGLTQGIQGVRSSAIQPALATEGARTGAFSQITNPILAYMSDLFSSNQNASAAQSIAGANKSGGAAAGGIGAIGSIIGAVLPMLFSDEDLKTNIEDTGLKTPSGIPIKRWQYKGDNRWFEGPIAQDVEKVHPAAVSRSRVTGHRFVDLHKTDVPFRLVESALLMEV